jgi:hypothetical protein
MTQQWNELTAIMNLPAAANIFNAKLSPQGPDNELSPVIQKDVIDHHKSSPI